MQKEKHLQVHTYLWPFTLLWPSEGKVRALGGEQNANVVPVISMYRCVLYNPLLQPVKYGKGERCRSPWLCCVT